MAMFQAEIKGKTGTVVTRQGNRLSGVVARAKSEKTTVEIVAKYDRMNKEAGCNGVVFEISVDDGEGEKTIATIKEKNYFGY